MSEDIYQDHILEHYENPHHRGTLAEPTLECHDLNPLCGDEIRIQACLDEHGHLAPVCFEGQGCIISLAAASMLMEAVSGKTLAEIKSLDRQAMLALLGVPLTTMRVKCAMLPLRTLQKAILLYEAQGQDRSVTDHARGHSHSV
ncbi:MAG: iron-sulfur cluster assembly scaffold protein [Candidatus Tectimicrobiota bacterium]